MIETIKKDLESLSGWNYLYSDLTDEEYKQTKELIKDDYGFLDVVLNFDDYKQLDNLKNSIPDSFDSSQRKLVIKSIIEQYVNYKIVKSADVEKYNCSELEDVLFGKSFEKYRESKWILFYRLPELLKEEAESKENKEARLLLLLDSIEDIHLQKAINNIISSRSITLFGYTTKEDLLSYYTDQGNLLQDPHDYITKTKILRR